MSKDDEPVKGVINMSQEEFEELFSSVDAQIELPSHIEIVGAIIDHLIGSGDDDKFNEAVHLVIASFSTVASAIVLHQREEFFEDVLRTVRGIIEAKEKEE